MRERGKQKEEKLDTLLTTQTPKGIEAVEPEEVRGGTIIGETPERIHYQPKASRQIS